MDEPLILDRVPARVAVRTWWARSFQRSFEDLAVGESDVTEGRSLARSKQLAKVLVMPGMASGVVRLPTMEQVLAQARIDPVPGPEEYADVVASSTAFGIALLDGQVSEELISAWAEAGLDPVPSPDEITTACECSAWTQPCAHALAVLHRVAIATDTDPMVLLALRGLTVEVLADSGDEVDRAAAEARRLLRELEEG